MADDGGDRRDELDALVLDEDFVRGAKVTELDAKRRRKAHERREKQFAKENRKYHRRVRRTRLRRKVFSYRTATFLVLAVAIGLGVPGLNGVGPLSYLGDEVWPSDGDESTSQQTEVLGAAQTAESVLPGQTTSTTLDKRLERRSYKVGDCVLWDEATDKAYTLDTKVVSCDEPHVIEVTGKHIVEDQGREYPSEAYWDAMFDTGVCLTMGEAHLGAKLDPNGNYYTSGVMPSPESWRYGDREVYCGLARVPWEEAHIDAPGLTPFTGRVEAKHQYRVYAIGSCLGPEGDGWTAGTVDCNGPHVAEIAGHVDLSGRATSLPDESRWQSLVGDACERQSRDYAKTNYREPVQTGWFHIQQASWDAGRRTVVCFVGEYRGNDWATITRRIGA